MEAPASWVTHEMKNMLLVVRSLVFLAKRDTAQTMEHFVEIEHSIDRIEKVLRDYLAVARPLPPPVPFAVDRAVLEAIAQVAPRAEAAGITLEEALEPAFARGHAARLREALANLIGNAVEATPRGGHVRVTVRRDDGLLVIEIADSGRGLSADDHRRIGVEAFTTRAGGSGLGVMLARAVIVQHGGTLDYRDNEGGGTIARVSLPHA